MKRMFPLLALLAVFPLLVASWLLVHASAPRVKRWAPGTGRRIRRGGLSARVFGTGDEVVMLLPGIAASGTFYGAAYDRLGDAATVVVVDPLGFGASLPDDRETTGFTLEAHLDALDALLGELDLSTRPLTLVGHSMGASLAIHLAARRASVSRVIAFDAPLYTSREEALGRVHGMGWFEALLANGPVAERVCEWMCHHHDIATRLSVLINPTLPSAIAREGMLHTWPSYIGAFDSIVTSPDWAAALRTLESRGTPVFLINGADDPVPVPGRAAALAPAGGNIRSSTHPGRHDLPLAHPTWSALQVEQLVRPPG